MLILLFIIIGIIVLYRCPRLRFTLSHFPLVAGNAIVDAKRYIQYKKWRDCENYGRMEIYIADDSSPFGSGKTLNMIRDAKKIYDLYDDVEVYNSKYDEWVKQRVHIISNVKLFGMPYVPLLSTTQITDIVNIPEDENHDIHIYLILIDELGRLFNNRDWKTNLPSDLLSSILQQRKAKIILKGTVQDFSLFDATLRKVSAVVYSCSKKWRYLVRKIYNANDLERSGYNSEFVRCRGIFCSFATDRLYNSYDTNEVVEDLARSVIEGRQLSNLEVLQSSLTNLPYVPKAKKRKKVS